jgi:hypothetical protein
MIRKSGMYWEYLTAHELTHCAMQVVFKNLCKPYGVDHLNMKEEFEEVVRDCESKKDDFDLIKIVFYLRYYSKNVRHADFRI